MKRGLLYIVIFFTGGVVAYFITPTRIITKNIESKEDKETINSLRQQLRTKTKVQIKYVNGVKDSEIIDTDTSIDTDNKTNTTEKVDYVEKNKTEINPRRYYIEVGYKSDRTYYFSTHYSFIYNVHLGINFSSNFVNNTSAGLGIGLSF